MSGVGRVRPLTRALLGGGRQNMATYGFFANSSKRAKQGTSTLQYGIVHQFDMCPEHLSEIRRIFFITFKTANCNRLRNLQLIKNQEGVSKSYA